MTEGEWLASDDPKAMLAYVRDRGSDRRFRLFNCACVRRVWDALRDERLREAVRVAERHADGLVDRSDLGRAVTDANRARGKHDVTRAAYETVRYEPGGPYNATNLVVDRVSWHVATAAVPEPDAAWGTYVGDVYVPSNPSAQRRWLAARRAEHAAMAGVVRDVFGNPFRPASAAAGWLTPGVVGLARAIYEGRAFGRLAALADALAAAGCDESDLLAHCRRPAEGHVRGCWAVDLVLGKQ